jgi:hypothetical protein
MQGTVAKAVAATGRGHFGQPNRRVPPRSCGVQMRGELVISGDWLCPATVTSDDGTYRASPGAAHSHRLV